jgi:hypothetical protein
LATYIYINDSSSNTWQVGVSDTGVFSAASTSAQTPSPIYLNDYITNSTSWLLTVSTSGVLGATPETYSSGYPQGKGLVSPSGYNYRLVTTQNGVIVALYFEADEDYSWLGPLLQPFDPVVTVYT